MKIIDTTTYFEEELMMNLRFNILNNYVDKFIVSEARFTHSGHEKDIKFDSIQNHETLQKGTKIKKINILFNKIERND